MKQSFNKTINDRSLLKKQKPFCLWMTGLSGSGKSTLANAIEIKLFNQGRHTYILDGDNLRAGLNSNLSFSISDRKENIRRTAEVARLMVDAGLIVIVSLISPFEEDRNFARSLFKKEQFYELYVSTPLGECVRRDVKSLYKKANDGLIKDFTGIDSPYEIPKNYDLRLDTSNKSIEECISIIGKGLNIF